MGLLDGLMQQPQQGHGGLLGGIMGASGGQAPAQPPAGGQGQGMQLAMQLAQSPTPEMAQQIVRQLYQIGNQEAPQFEQLIQQAGGDPAALKQLAMAIVQKLGGQNA